MFFSSRVFNTKLQRFHQSNIKNDLCGVYISTNELGFENVLKNLKQQEHVLRLGQPRCHVGFSGWYNLDLICANEATHGLICDFNPFNKEFIDQTITVLLDRNTHSRFDFVRAMCYYVQEQDKAVLKLVREGKKYHHIITFSPNVHPDVECVESYIEIEMLLKRPNSWLSSDENFMYIQRLAKNNCLLAITLDIRDSDRLASLAKIYRDNEMEIDCLYLSNIYDYMKSGHEKLAFKKSVQVLISKNTHVVTCFSSLKLPQGYKHRFAYSNRDQNTMGFIGSSLPKQIVLTGTEFLDCLDQDIVRCWL